MSRVKKDVKPVLIQVGVALAVSFAAFLFARRRTRKRKPSIPPTLPCHSDHSNGTNSAGHRTGLKEDLHSTTSTHCSRVITSTVTEKHVHVDHSPGSGHSGEKEGLLLPEFDDLVKEFDLSGNVAGYSPKKDIGTPRSDVETPKSFITTERDGNEQEIKQLKSMVRMLQEKERNLEVQLLEYQGLKEQEKIMMELQNRLKINNMEAKLFNIKIESLKAENLRLEMQVADHSQVVHELEVSKSKIKMLKKKLKSEAEQNREHILLLQKKVAKLQDQECRAGSSGAEVFEKLKQLEHEVEDLRKSNLRLQLENSDLAQRLESTQLLANCFLEDSEAEALRKEGEHLRQENENLVKQMEQLQADRCADIGELVYLRWINACLRYELRNYQPPAGKTVARDLSRTLSPKSEEKAKRLILEYASTEGTIDKGMGPIDFDSDHWSSSQTSSQNSYFTDSGDGDEVFTDFRPSNRTHNPKKVKLFSKLRKLVIGKDRPYDQHHPSMDKIETPDVGVPDLCSPDSPRGSSSMATQGTDVNSCNWPGTSAATASRMSSRSSLDLRRYKSLKLDDTERFRRNSDAGSSLSFRKSVTGREDSTQENFPELAKYAQALKGSRSHNEGTVGRKSASYSSF